MLKKKLIIIADFVYPNYIGGSARIVYDFIKWLYKNRIDFNLVTRRGKGVYALREKDTFFENLIGEQKVKMISFNLQGVKDLLKIAKNLSSRTIIDIHHPTLALPLLLLNPKLQNIIYHFHGPIAEEYMLKTGKKGLGFILRENIQRYIIRRSKKTIVLSGYMKKKLLELNDNRKKQFQIIPPAVDIHKFKVLDNIDNKKRLRTSLGIPQDRIVLLTTRRLTKRTGVLELAKNFRVVNNISGNRLFLIIIGQGELKSVIEEIAKNNPNILFKPSTKEEELPLYYQCSDIYILPTLDLEGFGLVILEAFASGLPVIVSNRSGGGKEFVEKLDKNLIFKVDNASDLARAINYCFQKYRNKSVVFRKIAENFSSEKVYQKYYSILIEEFST